MTRWSLLLCVLSLDTGCAALGKALGDGLTLPTDTGDAGSGDTGSGDSDTADSGSGDSDPGDSGSGDSDAGDSGSGDSGNGDSGDNGAGDSGSGDSGDTAPDSAAPGALSVSPGSLDFGVVFVGRSSTARLSVENVGEGGLSGTVTVTGAAASDVTVAPSELALAAGAATDVTVTVTPSAPGDRAVTLVVDAGDDPLEIPVTATAEIDADADGYGSLATGGLDCDDTASAVHPGAPDAWYDGLDADCAGDDDYDQDRDGVDVDLDCDDLDPSTGAPTPEVLDQRDNDCNGLPDDLPVDTVATGVLYGTATSMGVGDRGQIALDADLDGDGWADLLSVTDTTYGTAYVVSGRALAGASDPLSAVDSAYAAGLSSYYPLTAVATPSLDLTGDGVPEIVLLGASESRQQGTAFVIAGDPSSATLDLGAPWASYTGDGSDDQLQALAMGDLDGDGANDVVTGAPKDNGTAGADVGSIGVFDGGGGAGAHTLASAVRVYGRAASDQLGARVTVGDVTGDGYADVLAGAPGDDRAGDSAGAVYLVAGDATLTWSSAVDVAAYASWTGLAAGDGVGGDALPTPGDVDGDGGLDVGVACEGCGAAWVVLQADLRPGAASLSAATHTFSGDPGDFASAMVLDGDLDGDGADEVVLGGDGADVTGENSGVVWVYRWSAAWGPTLGTADASATIAGALAGDSLGTGLGGGGDVDGDGRDDLVLGAVTADGPYVDGGALWFLPGW